MNELSFLIPVRGGSKRIPRKNMLEINGETLIARKVRQLLPLGKVYVGSDDSDMLNEARKHGAIAVRREKTNEGYDSANDMIREFTGLIEPCETVAWCHVCNALLSTETYKRAIDEFYKGLREGYDSLISVHEVREHFWNADMRTPCYNVTWCKNVRHLCAKELPPLYMQDGGIFINRYQDMVKHHYFFGDRPKLFVVPKEEFCDINEYSDYLYAKAVIENKN